jgi:hypothetical protein
MTRQNILVWAVVMALLAAAGSAHAQTGRMIDPGTPTTASQGDDKTFSAGFSGLYWPENWDEARWYVDGTHEYTETMGGQSDTTTFEYVFWTPGTHEVRVRAKWNMLGVPVWFGDLVWTVYVSSSVPSASRDSPGSPVKVYEGDTQAFTVRATDPGGDLKGAQWFLDGSPLADDVLSGGSDASTWSHTFDTSGTHEVKARVYDVHHLYSSFVYWAVNVTHLHTLTLSSTAGGSVTDPGEGSFDYDEGTEVALTATAEDGYHFTHWSGSLFAVSNPLICMMDNDCDVTANFAADAPAEPRTLTVSSTAGGCVLAPGEGRFAYDPGSVVRLQAKADAGCQFVGWSGSAVDAGLVADPNASRTTVTLDRDGTVRAHFVCAVAALYVDDDAPGDPGPGDAAVSDPNEDGTPEHPFDRIQEGIDGAGAGASVIVRAGTYFENIDLLGKDILLTSFDPDSADGGSYPVIDGAGAGPVVSFTKGEGPDCVVMGFVITRGQGEPAGGIYCAGSSPTIINCLVVGNRSLSPNGGAVSCVDSNAVFFNCTMAGNYGGESGAGLYTADSHVVVVNSILWANLPNEVRAAGGAEPNLAYCDVAGGWAGAGNLEADPLFAAPGHWADAENPEVVIAPSEAEAVWIDGDYHLRSERGRYVPAYGLWTFDAVTSPCIDAGDPVGEPSAEQMPNGGRINLGAYGGTQQASLSPAANE